MASGRRVVVGLSGGVDSSTAAALLVEQGHEVIGVMLRLWAEPQNGGCTTNLCCTADAVESARQVAADLGIPFYLLNVQDQFKADVVDPFVLAYVNGRTPNPCLACNRHIRFGTMLHHAIGLGADFLATGHYARVLHGRGAEGQHRLLRGVDATKDQSYVLYMLGQSTLAHVLWPLGDYTKAEVRDMALMRGLPAADRPDSQDLCFVGDGDYRDFLRRHAPQTARTGPIVSPSGERLGTHRGLAFYTVGQRKGLGLSAREPLYVVKKDFGKNSLVVAPEAALGRREFAAGEVSFVSGKWPSGELAVTAKIRYRAEDVTATLWPTGYGRVQVVLGRPLRDVTAGQAVVFYEGNVCLGGGIIE